MKKAPTWWLPNLLNAIMLSNFKLKAHKYNEAIKADLKSARKYLVGGFQVTLVTDTRPQESFAE